MEIQHYADPATYQNERTATLYDHSLLRHAEALGYRQVEADCVRVSYTGCNTGNPATYGYLTKEVKDAAAPAYAEAQRQAADNEAAAREQGMITWNAIVRPRLEAFIAQVEQRQATLAAIVETVGDANAKGRLADGLLPEAEQLDLARNHLLAPLDGFARYERMKKSCPDCEYGEREFETSEPDSLTAEEYEHWQVLKSVLPDGATTELVEHSAECRSCEATEVRRSVKVSLPLADLTITREYALVS